jgi:hypothetical protein
LRAKRKSVFFELTKKHSTALKFWLIASIPFLFFIYNHMRKKKKVIRQKDNFVIGVAAYTLFTVIALIFVSYILSQNTLIAEGFGGIKKPEAKVQVKHGALSFDQMANQAGDYIQNNIKTIAAANNAGDGGSTVDGVDIINVNRALVFYHENSDRYLAEMVFSDNGGQVKIDRFILKIKNDNDYSGGVYGQD